MNFSKLIPEDFFSGINIQNWILELLNNVRPFTESKSEYVGIDFFLNGKLNNQYHLNQLLKDISAPDTVPSSFRMRNVQKISPEIRKISSILEDVYKRDIFCNLYYTPAATRNCFDFHADHQETYIYQLQGKKEWMFPLNSSGEYYRFLREGALNPEEVNKLQTKVILMEEGKQIQIPYGYVHKAEMIGTEPSIHLTFATREMNQKFVLNEILNQMIIKSNLQDTQLEKINESDIEKLIIHMKDTFSSLSVGELVESVKKKEFIESVKSKKYGRFYPHGLKSNTD